jgi:hypothetical protein
MLPIISKIFGALKSGDVVKTVLEGADNLFTSKEEKLKLELELTEKMNAHILEVEKLANQQTEAFLADMKDARNREIAIVTSEKAPWLNKAITPILGLIIVISTLVIWALILFRNYEPKTNEAMNIGSLTTLAAHVIGYYFGSSEGGQKNSDILRKMAQE